MGKLFGNLAVVRGIVYYKLSPHEQKPFAGAITHGIPNLFIRAYDRAYTWLPTFICGYLIYIGVEEAYRLSKRKNPRDYVDEVDPNPPPPETDSLGRVKCKKKKKPEPKPQDS